MLGLKKLSKNKFYLFPNNKKGDAISLIIGMIVMVFVIAVICLVAGKFIPQLMNIMKSSDPISGNNDSVEVLTFIEENSIPWLDYFFVFVFFSTIIGLIISSIYVDTHPALLMIFIIVLVFVIIFGGIFANAYVTIGESSTMSTTYNQFTSTKAIFNNLPLILFITGIIVIFILYGKAKNSGGGM